MRYLDYPKIGEGYYEERLPDGLLVRVVKKRGFARKYAFLAVDFGSIDTKFTLDGEEKRVPDGIAHYLEHKMFDLPGENAMDLFAAYGGSPNAFTSYAMTAYYINVSYSKKHAVEFMGESVTTADLAQKYSIKPTPTLIFLSHNGKELFSYPGFMPKEKFMRALEFFRDSALEQKDTQTIKQEFQKYLES